MSASICGPPIACIAAPCARGLLTWQGGLTRVPIMAQLNIPSSYISMGRSDTHEELNMNTSVQSLEQIGNLKLLRKVVNVIYKRS